MLENVRLAFQGIWSHKMRSFLTMLGIIIGIAAIISIVSTIQGTNNALRDQLVGSGNNTVKVNLSSGGSDYSIYDEASIPYGIPTVSSATVRKILALDNVENVTCYNSRFVSEGVYYQNQPLTEFYIYGIDDRYFDTVGYKLKSGRNFHKEDSADFRKVVILDQTAANNLFQEENPLGKTVEINSQPFTVIGIVYSSVAYDPDIQNIEDYYTYEDGSNGLFFIPKASWPIIFTYDEPENVIVKATSTEDMTKAGQRTANILMTERTSEIGLKKAIGARKGVILAQFLTEAAVLTSLGGLLGVGAGIAMSQLIHRFSGIPVAINVPAAVIAVLFSMVIGIVFGLLPSVQASNLDPIEALRRE